MSVSAPGTPSRRHDVRSIRRASEINDFTRNLSLRYGLRLPIPRDRDSPVSRRSPLRNEDVKKGDEIVWLIGFLSRQNYDALEAALTSFDVEAETLRIKYGWIYKPGADRDVIPGVRGGNGPEMPWLDRRRQLVECLLRMLREVRHNKYIPCNESAEPMSSLFKKAPCYTELDTTPIPLKLGPRRHSKRPSDEFENVDADAEFKKPRLPDSSLPEIIRAVDSITMNSSTENSPQRAVAPSRKSGTAALFLGNPLRRESTRKDNLNTSFNSNFSTIFTEKSFGDNETNTQASSVNVSFGSENASHLDGIKAMDDCEPASSQYGSIDDEDFIEIYSDDPSQESAVDVDVSMGTIASERGTQLNIKQRLETVFPKLPQCLKRVPLCLRYEITRVFLHAEVEMNDLEIPDYRELLDYNVLWEFLKGLPQLQGKPIPEKSAQRAWASSQANWTAGPFDGVLLSASLKFNSSRSGPFFKVRLQPLSTNLTHRLGRRFGNDRFFELSVPNLTKFKSPGNADDIESTRKEIIHWLSYYEHQFLGIDWRSFCVKDVRSKKVNNIELKSFDDAESAATNQIFLFGVNGIGFRIGKMPPMRGEDPAHRTKFSVQGMLNWLIPFHLEKNKNQPFLKLFSRISLGLSKTYETIELGQTQIHFKPKDLLSATGEVMNDGCGQISRKLAHSIAQKLNLDYIPSAFQARIGGAKGMWIVDVKDFSDKTYIEIYPSQAKWDGGAKGRLVFSIDQSHRMFEVLRWTGPARSAALNLQFLPILEDRGRSNKGKNMREAISRLLENGLTHEIGRQRAAMENAQSFRKWVRDTDSGIADRIKLGQVQYWAGMPRSLGEKLNLLLDAGFNPKDLRFVRDLAWDAYVARCEVLKTRLNITVGRSAYLTMVVDFSGILKPNEVHIGFSTAFKDESTGFCDTILSNMDILVARSPAHYTSDIQKVRAVFKPELSALKDVVVFSTLGDSPLAGKLSGGDYDGDIAWCCWQTEIVNEFENAEVPPRFPDLVKEGYVTKTSTTYAELAAKHPEPTDVFLAESFDFNLKQNLLGICTNFKEKLCYTKNSVNCYEAIYLSTLLSSLVDQAKQGYTFTNENWAIFKADVVREKVKEPNYKRATLDGKPKHLHLIDYLKFKVAQETINKTLKDFNDSLQTPQYWDDDVVKFAQFAREEAKTSDEWATLLEKLDSDIGDVRAAWKAHFRNGPDENSNESSKAGFTNGFTNALNDIYPKWLAIMPAMDTAFTRLLTLPYLPDPELSPWALLKASVLFSTQTRNYVGKMVWWMAGKQLAHLKAMSRGIVPVIPTMYAMLKPDNTFVKLMQVEEHDPKHREARAETEIEGDEGMEDVEYEYE